MTLRSRLLAGSAVLALGLGGILVVAAPASAANAPIVVKNNLTLVTDVDSLPWAVHKANTDLGADSIVFDMSAGAVTSPLVLASDLEQITDDLEITGPGQGALTIDAPNTVFEIVGTAPPIAVGFSDLTITSGNVAACGISSDDANVTVANVTASDFGCTGISVTDGALRATDVTVENDATGIAFTGSDPAHSLTLTRIHADGAGFSGVNAVIDGGAATVTDVEANDAGIFGFYLATTASGTSTVSGVQADRAGIVGIAVITDDHATAAIADSSAADSTGQGINLQATDHSAITALRVTSARSASSGLWLSATASGSIVVQSSIVQDTIDNSGVWVDQLASGGTLTISRTTITGNHSNDDGGGIDVNTLRDDDTSLTVSDSTISGNTAVDFGAGIYLRQIGSGVTSTAKVVIERTTVADNRTTSGYGAGIAINEVSAETSGLPTVLIDSSTISNNRTPAGGGGIYISPNAATTAAVVKVLNTTISGNGAQAGGAVYIEGPGFGGPSLMTVMISHSTLTKNSANTSGGLEMNPGDFELSVDNSIIADNGTYDLQLGSPYTIAYSLIQNPDPSVTIPGGVGNITAVDPELGPLASNGGSTLTHLASPGSPAYNAGDPSFTGAGLFDQRGQARVYQIVDMGAVEWQPALAHTGSTPPAPETPLVGLLLLFAGVAMVAFSRLQLART